MYKLSNCWPLLLICWLPSSNARATGKAGNGNGKRERERTTDGAQNGIRQVENALINVRSHVPFTAVTFRIVPFPQYTDYKSWEGINKELANAEITYR